MYTCPKCKATEGFKIAVTLYANFSVDPKTEELDLTLDNVDTEVDETNVMVCGKCEYKAPMYFFDDSPDLDSESEDGT